MTLAAARFPDAATTNAATPMLASPPFLILDAAKANLTCIN
jgi:hypothetical protein